MAEISLGITSDQEEDRPTLVFTNPQNKLLSVMAFMGAGVAILVILIQLYYRSIPPWNSARGIPTVIVGCFLLIFGLFVGFRSLRKQEWRLSSDGFVLETSFFNYVLSQLSLSFQDIKKVQISKTRTILYRNGRYSVDFVLEGGNRRTRVIRFDEFQGKGRAMAAQLLKEFEERGIPVTTSGEVEETTKSGSDRSKKF